MSGIAETLFSRGNSSLDSVPKEIVNIISGYLEYDDQKKLSLVSELVFKMVRESIPSPSRRDLFKTFFFCAAPAALRSISCSIHFPIICKMEALAGRVSGLAGPVVGTGTGIAGGVIFTTAAVLLIERTFYDRIERALEEDYWNFKQPIVHRGTFIGGAAAVISSLFLQNVPSNFTPIRGAFIAASVAGVRAIVSRASFLKQPAPYIENNIDIGVAMAGGLITAGPLGLIIGGLVAAGYIVAERVSDHLSAE